MYCEKERESQAAVTKGTKPGREEVSDLVEVDKCGLEEWAGRAHWTVQEGWGEGLRVAVEAGGNQKAAMGGQAARM